MPFYLVVALGLSPAVGNSPLNLERTKLTPQVQRRPPHWVSASSVLEVFIIRERCSCLPYLKRIRRFVDSITRPVELLSEFEGVRLRFNNTMSEYIRSRIEMIYIIQFPPKLAMMTPAR